MTWLPVKEAVKAKGVARRVTIGVVLETGG
jgi:hypothetical protein